MVHDNESSEAASIITLIKTNELPSPLELKLVEDALSTYRAQAASLDAEIEHVEDTLACLQDKRLAVERDIENLERVKSPIRAVPDDILRCIFEFSAPWGFQDGVAADSFNIGDYPEPAHPLEMYECPWNISQVCRCWRSIALHHERLWTALYVDFSHWKIETRTADQLKRRVALVHARARHHPVRVFLKYPGHSPEIFSWMVKHYRSQWSSVRFEIHDQTQAPFPSDDNFPRLAHLYICGEIASPLRLEAPALRSLEREGQCAVHAAQLLIPWAQITRYKSFDTHLNCIALMPNLEELIVENFGVNTSEIPSKQRTVLSSLGLLSIKEELFAAPNSVVRNLFDQFDFPSLHTLQLHARPDYRAFVTLKPGTFPSTLSNLSLEGIVSQAEEYSKVLGTLKIMPYVTRLHLRGMAVANFIGLLANDPAVFTRLISLHISFPHPQEIENTVAVGVSLTELIEARASTMKRVAFFTDSKDYALPAWPFWEDQAVCRMVGDLKTQCEPLGIEVEVCKKVHRISDFDE